MKKELLTYNPQPLTRTPAQLNEQRQKPVQNIIPNPNKKTSAQIHVEVWKQDQKHYELRVKAQSDYNFIGGVPQAFTITLKSGKNLITRPSPYLKHGIKGVKEYLTMYSDHLTYYSKYRGMEANHEWFFFKPLETRGMWNIEGLKISEQGKMIWWLWERREYEREHEKAGA